MIVRSWAGHGLGPLVIVGLAVSLAGSLWSLLAGERCARCSRAAQIIGGVNLAAIGAAYYALLLAAAYAGSARLVFDGAFAAAGVHLALVSLLLRYRLACPPCLITAAGAWVASAAALAIDPRSALHAVILAPVAVVAAEDGTRVLRRQARIRSRQEAEKATRQILEEGPAPPDGVRMVVYRRPDCRFCEQFEKEILPALHQEFGERLNVEERLAWKRLATPTLVLVGRRATYYAGLPKLEEARAAIRYALTSEG